MILFLLFITSVLEISFAAETNDFLQACKDGNDKYVASVAIPPSLVRAVDSTGRTCLHLAAENEKCHVVELVVQHKSCDENVTVPETGETALMIAVQKQHMRCFRALTQYHPPLLSQRLDGMTALHLAATRHLLMTRTLSDNKALLNIKTHDGMTALMFAIISRNYETAHELITKGADINVANDAGETAIHYAARIGSKELVIRLLHHGAAVDAGTKVTPLLVAISANQTEVAQILMNKDADAKAVNKSSGLSALFMALDVRNADIINGLITNGADLYGKGASGMTPLILAAQNGVCDILHMLVDRTSVRELNEDTTDSGNNALLAAIENNRIDCVRVLIDKEVNVNFIRSGDGLTPLHVAVRAQSLAVAKMLLEAGAELAKTDQKNRSPLSMALQFCIKDISEFFLQQKMVGDLNQQNMDALWRQRPLHLAARCNFPEIIKTLLSKGAYINAKDGIDLQPLHMACHSGKAEAAIALINAGADIHYPGKSTRNRTPIFYCSSDGLTNVVRLLLQKGADVNGRSSISSPLLSATAYNKTDTALLLLENGANIKVTWKDVLDAPYEGDTALHLAARNGNMPIVKKLIERSIDVNARNVKGETALDVASKDNGVADFIRTLNSQRTV